MMIRNAMTHAKWPGALTILWLGAFLLVLALPAQGQKLASDEEAAKVLTLEQLSIEDGVVSGQVRNKAKHAVREVELLMRYTWLWEDERNPGSTDPGTSAYYTLKETIAPGEAIKFSYKPSPPLPKISGGRFYVSAKIAGFTEIIPQPRK